MGIAIPKSERKAVRDFRFGRSLRPAEERFWRFVEKTNGCWLWIGCASNVDVRVSGPHAHRAPHFVADGERSHSSRL